MKTIVIENTESGVVIWVKEKIKIDGKMKTVKHWIVDASVIKTEGKIYIALKQEYKKAMVKTESDISYTECYKLKTHKR